MKQSQLGIGVSLLVGVLLGVGVARLLDDAPPARSAGSASASAPAAVVERSSPAVELEATRAPLASAPSQDEPDSPRAPERTVHSEARSEADAPGEPVFSAALEAYARAGIEHGWAQVRTDPVPPETLARLLQDYEESVLTQPAALGHRAAQERTQGELELRSLDSSDGIALIATSKGDDVALAALARAPDRFAALFRTRSAGTAVSGPDLDEGDPLHDGAVLDFPAGVFAVADLARGRMPFPRDVTLRGAGMNLTLLVLDELSPRGALERFAIEDCTVFAESGIADVRTAPSVVALRRVRLVGFDCGAGGSYAMNLNQGCALHALQCRFEGGYGRNPGGYANLMRNTAPLVARFDSCTFERMSLDHAQGSGVLFVGCVMNDMVDEPRGVEFASCSVTLLPEDQRWSDEARRRDLNDLFPGWRERVTVR